MYMLVFLQTTLLTEIFELPFISNGREKSFTTTDVFLTITTHLQSLLVILKTHIGAELFDVRAKAYAVLPKAC